MKIIRTLLVLLCTLGGWQAASADNALPTQQADTLQRAFETADRAAQTGPRDVPLGEQATLHLPAHFSFIPKAEGKQLMEAMGNRVGDSFYGMIVSNQSEGFISVNFIPAGYIKDDDAKDWDADELLKNIKEGTEADNESRRQRGIPEFEVVGWIEKPGYESGNHRLVWSALLRDKGAAANDRQGVNYNTYLLGREGYLKMNLVTDKAHIEAEKPMAKQILAATDFNSGKRYQDFSASSGDKVAEYGLAALVGGIAAKKIGLLAMLGVFLLKAWKLALVGIFGVGAAVRKFFGKKEDA